MVFNFNININKGDSVSTAKTNYKAKEKESGGLFKNIGSVFDIILPPTMRLGLSTEDIIEKLKGKK